MSLDGIRCVAGQAFCVAGRHFVSLDGIRCVAGRHFVSLDGILCRWTAFVS